MTEPKKDGAPGKARRQSSPQTTTSKYARDVGKSSLTTSVNGKHVNGAPHDVAAKANGATPAAGKTTPAQISEHNRRVALAWAAAGISIFPCRSVDERCGRITFKAKMPRVSWGEEATTDAAVINAWWDRWADSIPAIDLRRAGLFVVDPDRHGGPDGVAAWRRLCAEHGWSDDTQPVVATSGNGEHCYFTQPDGPPLNNSEGDLPDGINVRANGYVIAPGAMLPNGKKWRTRKGSPDLMESFKAGAIPPVPDWLVKILRTRTKPERAPRGTLPPKGVVGAREHTYAKRALEQNAQELAATQEGKRNSKLNAIAFRMGRMIASGWVERKVVEDALRDACITNGLDSVDDGASEADATMLSGIEAGMTYPMEPLNDFDPTKYCEAAGREVVERDGVLIDAETGEILDGAGAAQKAPSQRPSLPVVDYVATITARPGLVSDIVHFILSASRRPQPALAVLSAIVTVGTAASRQMRAPTDASLNLYALLIGPTGCGKDTPQKAPEAIFDAAKLDRQMLRRGVFKSEIALCDHVYRHPVSVAVINEFGDVVKATNSHNASTSSLAIMTTLRDLWDGNTTEAPRAMSRPPMTLRDPCLSLLCASTPSQFYDAVGNAEALNGFLNRFILAKGVRVKRARPSRLITDVPDDIAHRIREIADLPRGENPARYRTPLNEDSPKLPTKLVRWADAGVEAAWDAYDEECSRKVDQDKRREQFGPRCAHNCIKIATIMAIADNPHDPAVTIEPFDIGKAIVESSLREMAKGFNEHETETPETRLRDKILDRIREAGGTILKRQLVRSVQVRMASLNDITEMLVEAGQLEVLTEKPKGGGYDVTRYRLLD